VEVCRERKVLTRLDGRGCLVTESGDALAGLVESRLLRVGSGWWEVSIYVGRSMRMAVRTLLLNLVAESFASKIRHVDYCLVGWRFGLRRGLL
jgi:hypothetical protein